MQEFLGPNLYREAPDRIVEHETGERPVREFRRRVSPCTLSQISEEEEEITKSSVNKMFNRKSFRDISTPEAIELALRKIIGKCFGYEHCNFYYFCSAVTATVLYTSLLFAMLHVLDSKYVIIFIVCTGGPLAYIVTVIFIDKWRDGWSLKFMNYLLYKMSKTGTFHTLTEQHITELERCLNLGAAEDAFRMRVSTGIVGGMEFVPVERSLPIGRPVRRRRVNLLIQFEDYIVEPGNLVATENSMYSWVRTHKKNINTAITETFLRNSFIPYPNSQWYVLTGEGMVNILARYIPNDALYDPGRHCYLMEKTVFDDNGIYVYYVEISVAVMAQKWFKDAKKWSTRVSNVLSKKTADEVLRTGCHLIHRPCPTSDSSENGLDWKFEFCKAEEKLFAYHQNKVALMFAYAVINYIITYQFMSITSFRQVYDPLVLRTVVLQMAEKECPELYNNMQVGTVCQMLLDRYKQCVREGYLKHYFLPKVNLLEDVSDEAADDAISLVDKIMALLVFRIFKLFLAVYHIPKICIAVFICTVVMVYYYLH
jgi:hypothetical protein